jgi:hypothetical protein
MNEHHFPRAFAFTVYVKLLGEGTDVWRPTQAERVDENIVRLLPTADYGACDEQWEFLPGSIVRCENRILSGEEVVVVISRADIPPGPKKELDSTDYVDFYLGKLRTGDFETAFHSLRACT